MTWVIFIAVGALFFGMISWLKPSARDKHLTDLRMKAMQNKLQVTHMLFNPSPEKNGVRDDVMGTSYSFLHPTKRKGTLKYRIVKQAAWDTDFLPEGYAWHDQGTQEDAQRFTEALADLTDELLMLEVFDHRVTMITSEQKEANADNYQGFLKVFLPG